MDATKSPNAIRQQRYRDRQKQRNVSNMDNAVLPTALKIKHAPDPKPLGKQDAIDAGVTFFPNPISIPNKDQEIFPRGEMREIKFGKNFTLDTWQNLINGMGVRGHDRKLSTTFAPEARLMYQDLTDIYRSDGLGRIVLSRIIGDMTRAWWTVEGDTDKKIEGELKRIDAKKAIKKALTFADLYGGALGVMILDDGVDSLEKPVNLARLKGVKQILVFDRYRIVINPADLYLDPSNESYGHPQIYRVTPIFGAPFFVHESRVLRFEGDEVPDVTRFQNQGWGDSIFQSCWDRLRACGEMYSNIEQIIGEFIMGVFTIPNLHTLLAEHREEEIRAYLSQIDQSKHMLNSILTSDSKNYNRISASVNGLKDLADLILESLCAQKGFPMCLLYGRSQGGLSADEASQVRFWYDRVSVMQEEKMLSPIERLVSYVNIGLGHPIDDNSPIKFCSLWQPTEIQLIDMRNKQAMTDDIYIKNGTIVDPQGTIAKSRFGGQAYSPETVLSKNEDDEKFKTSQEESAELDLKNQLALEAAKQEANPNKPATEGKDLQTGQVKNPAKESVSE